MFSGYLKLSDSLRVFGNLLSLDKSCVYLGVGVNLRMTKNITYILIILTLFSSCLGPCETEEEWNVDIYTIKK